MNKKWLLVVFFIGLGAWWLWTSDMLQRELVEQEASDGAAYTNEALGYRVTYPAEWSALEYTSEDVAFGTETDEGFDAQVSLTYLSSVEGETWGSFEAFVEARTVAMCAADGPEASVYCTDFVEREPFTSDTGEEGFRAVLNQETVSSGDGMLLEQRNRGPFYIFSFSEESGAYAALVIHPPILGEDEDVAETVAGVARSFERVDETGDGEGNERFGFIRDIDFSGERVALIFDEAEMLSGREAEDAAIRTGDCMEATREECTPNDFYIENIDKSTELLAVADDVEVVMVTYRQDVDTPLEEHSISFTEFVGIITDESKHWNQLPYTVTLNEEGAVTKIEEVYVP